MSRNTALQNRIEDNEARIEDFDARLDVQRERLLTYYYNLELAISKIQANMSIVENLAPLDISYYRSNRSNG